MGTWNVTPEQRRELITKKAYELFVKKGSKPGHELDDWLEAEKIVDRELKEKGTPQQQASQPATPTPASTSSAPRTPTPAPSPIRNTPSKVGGYKRVTG